MTEACLRFTTQKQAIEFLLSLPDKKDRRADRRYPIELGLWWKIIWRGKFIEAGSGKTLNISSGGILFEAKRTLQLGSRVLVDIKWPPLIANTTAMKWVIFGRVVRSDEAGTAVDIMRNEFKTSAPRS